MNELVTTLTASCLHPFSLTCSAKAFIFCKPLSVPLLTGWLRTYTVP